MITELPFYFSSKVFKAEHLSFGDKIYLLMDHIFLLPNALSLQCMTRIECYRFQKRIV